MDVSPAQASTCLVPNLAPAATGPRERASSHTPSPQPTNIYESLANENSSSCHSDASPISDGMAA